MTIFGWDVSQYDYQRGPVDIAAARRDGIDFVIVKAYEGSHIQDPYFRRSLEKARDAGMPVIGAYFIPRTPGNGAHGSMDLQVRTWIDWLDSQTPWWRTAKNLFLMIDLEIWSNSNGIYDSVSVANGKLAASLLEQLTGRRIAIYAPKWAYGDTLKPVAWPLVASSYGANPATGYRTAYTGVGDARWVAYSGVTPAILQFGSKAIIAGQGNCDINAYRGTVPDLMRLLTPNAVPSPLSQGATMLGLMTQDNGQTVYVFDGVSRRLLATEDVATWQSLARDGAFGPIWRNAEIQLMGGGPDLFGPIIGTASILVPDATRDALVSALDGIIGQALHTALASPETKAILVDAANTAEDS